MYLLVDLGREKGESAVKFRATGRPCTMGWWGYVVHGSWCTRASTIRALFDIAAHMIQDFSVKWIAYTQNLGDPNSKSDYVRQCTFHLIINTYSNF